MNFVIEKYNSFIEKKGYLPKMFNPYNCAEIKDIAPTMSTYCGSCTSSATVLIVEGGRGNMLKGGKQLTETIEKNIDKFEKGKVLNMDLYNRTVNENLSQTLCDPSHNSQRLFDGFRIRKLTPKECWRLMGFDDSDFEKAEKVNSNTQLYKQAGNSICVPVLECIFMELFKNDTNLIYK